MPRGFQPLGSNLDPSEWDKNVMKLQFLAIPTVGRREGFVLLTSLPRYVVGPVLRP